MYARAGHRRMQGIDRRLREIGLHPASPLPANRRSAREFIRPALRDAAWRSVVLEMQWRCVTAHGVARLLDRSQTRHHAALATKFVTEPRQLG